MYLQDSNGIQHSLDRPRTVIASGEDSHIRLTGLPLAFQAEIIRDGDHYFINVGQHAAVIVTVENQRVQSYHRLQPGDCIGIGPHALTFASGPQVNGHQRAVHTPAMLNDTRRPGSAPINQQMPTARLPYRYAPPQDVVAVVLASGVLSMIGFMLILRRLPLGGLLIIAAIAYTVFELGFPPHRLDFTQKGLRTRSFITGELRIPWSKLDRIELRPRKKRHFDLIITHHVAGTRGRLRMFVAQVDYQHIAPLVAAIQHLKGQPAPILHRPSADTEQIAE